LIVANQAETSHANSSQSIRKLPVQAMCKHLKVSKSGYYAWLDRAPSARSMANVALQMNVRPSMGTVGDAYDNAMAESFFATLECELIDRRVWKTQTEVRLAMFTWIEAWYNPHRRHSSLAQMSPINFERMKSNEKLNANKEQKIKQTFKMSI
jgi:transposase InsO family protein